MPRGQTHKLSEPGGLHTRPPSAFSPREKQSGVRKLPLAHSEPLSAMGQTLLPDPTANSRPHLLRPVWLLPGQLRPPSRWLAKPSHLPPPRVPHWARHPSHGLTRHPLGWNSPGQPLKCGFLRVGLLPHLCSIMVKHPALERGTQVQTSHLRAY